MIESNEEIRYILKSYYQKGENATQAAKKICDVYGPSAVSVRVAQIWFKRFKSGNFDVKDAPRSGRPVTDKMYAIFEKVEQDRHVSSYDVAEELGIDHKTVLAHLKKAGYTKKLDSWVPHELTERNLMNRKVVAERRSASTSQQPDLDLLDPNDQSDSSLISDPEVTSGAPAPSGPDVGPRSSSVVFPCKACSKTITSFRYRCLVCPNYDMCGECEGRGGHHDDHYVLRVPMQRPTVEVVQVESAVRRALSSSTTWNKVFKSTAEAKVGKKKRFKKTGSKPDETRNSGDSEDTGNEPSDTVIKTEITLHESGTTEPKVAGADDEPEVKVELVIKEEVDPLDEEDAASAFLQNIHERQTTSGSKDVSSTQVVPSYHITQASQGVPWSFNVPLTQGAPQSLSVPLSKGGPSKSVPPSQGIPPSKRRRADEHRSTTTTHSHKTTPTTNEPTGLCRETCPSSTAATSSESGSKVDVFVLKKRTRPADENYD